MNQIKKEKLSKIGVDAEIAILGNVTEIILGYISIVLIARFIGARLYGIFLLGFTVIKIGLIFSNAGLDNGLLRFVALYDGKNDNCRIKGIIISGTILAFLFSLFFMILLIFSARVISLKFFNKPELEMVLKILAVCLPFSTLSVIWLSSVQGFQFIKYKIYINKLIRPTIRLFCLALLFYFGLRLWGVILASIATSFISFFLSLHYLKKIFPFHKKEITPIFENKELIQFSIPLFFTGFLNFIIHWIDVLMIGYFMTSFDVGIYGCAVKVSNLGTLILSSFNTIFAPMISELHGRGGMGEVEDLFKIVTKWIFTLTFPIFLIVVFFARNIMGVFGSVFVIGTPCLIILIIAQLANSCVGSAGYMLMMTGRPKMNLINAALLCVLNITLNYILIPKYGIIGAAIATGISIVLVNILRLGEVYYFLEIHPYKLSFFKPLSAGIISIFIVYLSAPLFYPRSIMSLIFQGAILITLYILLLKLFKFDKEDKIILRRISHIVRILRGKNRSVFR